MAVTSLGYLEKANDKHEILIQLSNLGEFGLSAGWEWV